MKRTWTIIGVSDVPRSFKWYQSLFGQPETQPAHPYFGQILDTDGTVLLCFHQWGEHEHPSLTSPDTATPGNGLLLFFRVDDFGLALKRARTLVTRFEDEPNVNQSTGTEEFSLRDPDGYYVHISAADPRPADDATAFALTTDWAQEFAREWIASWNSHDLDRILSHYADDFEMRSPLIRDRNFDPSGVLRGKDHVRAYWAKGLQAVPPIKFELHDVYVGVSSLGIVFRSVGRAMVTEVLIFNNAGKVVSGNALYGVST